MKQPLNRLLSIALIIGLGLLFTDAASAQSGKGAGKGNKAGRYFVDQNGDGICDNFVDANNDGVCDKRGTGVCGGTGACDGTGKGKGLRRNFVDLNKDGLCDNFVDANEDGICDKKGTGGCGGSGTCDGTGPKGKGFRGGRR